MVKLKTLTAFIFTLFISTTLFAQSSSTEAKAAYMLAEDAFATGDWKATLNYLEECKNKLGTPNCKVFYLQLMTEMELAKGSSDYYLAAEKTIADFEKAPDVKDFNEEKALEVMKIKLRLKEIRKKLAVDEKLAQEAKEKEKWLATLGGIIVYEKDGHGLVVTREDIGKMKWGKAKQACEELVLNGFDDWHLPSREELKLIQELYVKDKSNFQSLSFRDFYWSSEGERSLGITLGVGHCFATGNQTSYGLALSGYVRAVRKF